MSSSRRPFALLAFAALALGACTNLDMTSSLQNGKRSPGLDVVPLGEDRYRVTVYATTDSEQAFRAALGAIYEEARRRCPRVATDASDSGALGDLPGTGGVFELRFDDSR